MRCEEDWATNAAPTDPIDTLDTVAVPIVVIGRDFRLVRFNKTAADVLRLSPSDIGRSSRDISVLAGLPRLEQQSRHVIASGVESRVDFRDADKWFVVGMSPYTPSSASTPRWVAKRKPGRSGMPTRHSHVENARS